MRRRLGPLAAAVAATLALSACGAKHDQLTPVAGHAQSLTLMLDWLPNADHVGLYEGLADGAFRQAGLNVHVEVPPTPAAPLQLLQAGKVQVAISYEPEVLLARDQMAPVVAIGAIVQRPLTSIISLGSQHITTPAQLRGKTVGDAGIPYQHAYLETILRRAGVPPSSVHEVDVGDNLVGSMLSGRVNATLGGFSNYEAIQLRQAGKRPNVIPVDQAGVPEYDELVVVTTENEIAHDGSLLWRFVQALGRSYEAVRADPQAGANALVAANPSLSAKLQQASVTATLPSFFPSGAGEPWGWMPSAQWTAYGDWMLSQHLLVHPGAIIDASDNALLAGQGP